MISFFYASQIEDHADLAAHMFRDRTAQFRDRMKWDVTVDDMGWETDQYDRLDPIYVVVRDRHGGHAGSMRFLPTTGRTMLAEIFPHLTGGRVFRDPAIWECTRFCLSPGADAGVAQMLLLACAEVGLGIGVRKSVSVFDTPMIRLYRRLGWTPEILGRADGIAAGLWTVSKEVQDHLRAETGIASRVLQDVFDEARGMLALPIAA